MATLSRFSFEAFGLTLDEVSQKLDELTQETITREGGEPWLTTMDEIKKQCIEPRALMDPKSWIYVGKREVVFAGPTPMDSDEDRMRDGWRPQGTDL